MTWFKKIIIPICVVLIVLGSFQDRIGTFCKNLSGSLPQKLFWVSFLNKDVKKGDFVTFQLNRNGVKSSMLTKIVAGTPGDLITVKDGQIFINDRLIGSFQEKTSSGITLTPVVDGVIPKGKLFVATPHSRSFDSRYKEVGLILSTEVKGKSYAIF